MGTVCACFTEFSPILKSGIQQVLSTMCVSMRAQPVQRLGGGCTYRQQYKLDWDRGDGAGRVQGRNDLDGPSE